MDFKLGAESLAKQLGKENDYEFIETLKVDIIAARAVSIENKWKKDKTIDDSIISTINCVTFEKVKNNKCLDATGYVLRSKFKVPKPLSLGGGLGFISLSNSSIGFNRKTIDFISSEELSFMKYRKFGGSDIVAIYEDERIYITGTKINHLDTFVGTIRGVFLDPRQFKKLAIDYKGEPQCSECDTCNDCNSNEENCLDVETFELEENLFTDIKRIIFAARMQINKDTEDISINNK